MYTEELSKVGTPEYYEYLARKYLGYIYPDETVMVYVEE
jgi:cell division protein FtsB